MVSIFINITIIILFLHLLKEKSSMTYLFIFKWRQHFSLMKWKEANVRITKRQDKSKNSKEKDCFPKDDFQK